MPVDRLRTAVPVAVISFITFGLGIVVTILLGVIRSRVSADLSSINELISDIIKLEEYAVTYWSRSGRADDDLALEGKIHGALNATRFFDVDRICGAHTARFRELDVDLADAITGGAFETEGKTVSSATIARILEVSHQLRAHLRAVRRAQYWAN